MKINRNTSSFAKVSHLMQKQNTQERKLRTRTLIQAGGLLSLSGLLELCDISEGEDLQSDPEGYEKGTALLGILAEAGEVFMRNNDDHVIERYRAVGVRMLKQAGAKYS